MHLGLAAESLGDRPETALVQRLGQEVDAALDELRNVAHGLYPPLLARRGVPDALRATARDGALPVRIADDGAGFDPASAVEGAGLRNIADRVAAAGGTLNIDTALGRGTRVQARLPL